MNSPGPLISCLTVTQDQRRLEYLKKSIECFSRQTWPDKELVVFSDGTQEYARDIDRWLEKLGRDDISHSYIPGQRSLGEARNLCVAAARGSHVCQWDDDDLNHPMRLELQFQQMCAEGAVCSLMEDQWQYFYDSHELLWISWYPDLIPGTLMCERECLEHHPYPALALEEDAEIRENLRKFERLAILRNKGWLSMYTYHGLNAWGREHHERIRVSHNPGYVDNKLELVAQHLPAYDIDAQTVKILGSDGKSVGSALSRATMTGGDAHRHRVDLKRTRA